MTPKQAVKVGFLLKCADAGLTAEEAHTLVKKALDTGLSGLLSGAGKTLGGLSATALLLGAGKTLGGLSGAALLLGVGAPLGIGAGAGYLLAKSREDPTWDIEKAKMEELEEEYRRLAAEAQSNARRRRLAATTGHRVSRLGGPRLI